MAGQFMVGYTLSEIDDDDLTEGRLFMLHALIGEIEIPEVFDSSDVEDVFEAGHILSHLAFFGTFSLHVGLVLKHQLVDRDRLLNRML